MSKFYGENFTGSIQTAKFIFPQKFPAVWYHCVCQLNPIATKY